MRTRINLIAAGLVASLVMGLAVGLASAGRISTSNPRFRVTWAAMTVSSLENEFSIRCPLTLEGSFHSATIRKTRGALIGAITRAAVNGTEPPCTGGRLTVLQEMLPWHVTWDSFRGTLPRIETIAFLLHGYSWRGEATILGFRIFCLFGDKGRPEENLISDAAVNAETGQITTDTVGNGRYSSLVAGSSELCPRRAAFAASGQVFLLGSSTTRITVTLI
jgi:hypothetical protein